jgi:hypothetical protein
MISLLVEYRQVLDFICVSEATCFIFVVIKHAHICMHTHTSTIYTYMHLPHSPQVLLSWYLLMERFCVCQYAVYSSHRCLTACKFAMALHLGATFVVHIKVHKKCKLNKLISCVLPISFDLWLPFPQCEV